MRVAVKVPAAVGWKTTWMTQESPPPRVVQLDFSVEKDEAPVPEMTMLEMVRFPELSSARTMDSGALLVPWVVVGKLRVVGEIARVGAGAVTAKG